MASVLITGTSKGIDAICVSWGGRSRPPILQQGGNVKLVQIGQPGRRFSKILSCYRAVVILHSSINRTDTWFNRAVSANGRPDQPHRLPPLQLQAQGAANQRVHGNQGKFPKPRAFGPPAAIHM